jgi:hypothetical protein
VRSAHLGIELSVFPFLEVCMTHFKRIFLVFAALTFTSACTQPSVAKVEPSIEQVSLCEVSEWRRDVVAEKCKRGQKIVFLPDSWGNEQLPIIFAAVNCDLRYSVALTSGGVTCIYGPITPSTP